MFVSFSIKFTYLCLFPLFVPIYVRFCGKCVNYNVLSSSKNCNPLIVVRQDLFGRVNNLTSVFYASVLLLMINFVMTLSEFTAETLACDLWFRSHFDNVMTQSLINKRADAKNWCHFVNSTKRSWRRTISGLRFLLELKT